MKSCAFILVVVLVGLSGGRFSDENAFCLSSRTRETNVWRGRMIRLSTEMARVAEVDRGNFVWWHGKLLEVLKSRACPVVWPLWKHRLDYQPLFGKREEERRPYSRKKRRSSLDWSLWLWFFDNHMKTTLYTASLSHKSHATLLSGQTNLKIKSSLF